MCPGHKICVRNQCCARGQTGKHLCRQQCVLVCQGLYESRLFHVAFQIMAETSLAAFKAKDTLFVADWLNSKGSHKICSVFEGIQEPFLLSLACKSVAY